MGKAAPAKTNKTKLETKANLKTKKDVSNKSTEGS